jgi:hypothetical protein
MGVRFSTTSDGPAGLQSIDYQVINVVGGFYNFDWALQAISQVEQYGCVVTGFAACFTTVEQLSQITRFEQINDYFERTDPGSDTGRCGEPGQPPNLWRAVVFRAREYRLIADHSRRDGLGNCSRQVVLRFAAGSFGDGEPVQRILIGQHPGPRCNASRVRIHAARLRRPDQRQRRFIIL